MKGIEIARILTDANNGLCRALGQQESFPFDQQSQKAREGILAGIHRVLDGTIKTPEESHNLWMETRLADGWKLGPVKDVGSKISPCLVPYDELPIEEKVKDSLFINLVLAFKPLYKEEP